MNEYEEKIKYILSKILESYNVLSWSITRMIEKKNDEPGKRVYYVIPSLLLCFCFLDSLRRFNYIWEYGMDGKEDKNNHDNYVDFLQKFIVENDEYKLKNYSFISEELYDIRNELVHSFGLSELYKGKYISFFDGAGIDDKMLGIMKKSIISIKKIKEEDIRLIKISDFLKIIKAGIIKMFDVYTMQLKKETENNNNFSEKFIIHLGQLYEDLKNRTSFF